MKNILIVEDDANDVKLIQASLAKIESQVNIEVVSNGKDALDYLFKKEKFSSRKNPDPDLIILDLNLPLMNGFEVLNIIKSDKELRFIPVVGFSSSDYDLDISKCYELGINSYVVKPMDFINYKRTVSKMINFWVDINQSPSF